MKKLILFFAVILFSQTGLQAATTGKLTGKVTDRKSGEPLPFVNVILEGTSLGAATDFDGYFVILNVPPGKFNVKVQSVGYQTQLIQDVKIGVNLTTTLNIEMNEEAIEQQEVIVFADKFNVGQMGGNKPFSDDDIKTLPASEIDNVIQTVAGVTVGSGGDIHIRGGRSSEIAYYVNGSSISDAYDNGRGIDIDKSSVKELNVISGTFNAEYGNAMSGIINTVTKEGEPEYHGNLLFYGGDVLTDFYSYFPGNEKYNPVESYNIQASLSGPVPAIGEYVKFFVTGRYQYDDGHNYGFRRFNVDGTPGNGEKVSMAWSKRYQAQGNISSWITKNFKLGVEGLYSQSDYREYNHEYKLTPDSNPKRFLKAYNGSVSVTHMLGSAAYYTLKFSDFFREYDHKLYDNINDSRYQHPDSSFGTINYGFDTGGTDRYRLHRETNTMAIKLDFEIQAFENHLFKVGFEGKKHDLKFDGYTLDIDRISSTPGADFTLIVPAESAIGRDKYNASPIEAAFYLQDKIEFESMVMNIGVRVDYFNSRGNVMVDPRDPNIYFPLRENLKSMSIQEREPYFYKKASEKWQVSPRIGISYPISAEGVLHFSYGHFLQMPQLQYMFNRSSYKTPESGTVGDPFGNPDLEAESTIMYEIGFRQQFAEVYEVDLTLFYRDIRNWISTATQPLTYNNVSYGMYVNKDYSNVRGITLSLNKKLADMFSYNLSYTFQFADGSNSSPEDEYRAQQGNSAPTLYLRPLNWDQRHNINLSFLFAQESWGASLLGRYSTGLPYTPSINQFTADAGVSKTAEANSARRPNTFNIDMRLYKSFDFWGLNLTGFAQIYNLLDTRNVVNVFADSGSPDYTGDTATLSEDPARPNTIAEYQRYPWHYAAPRSIELGLELTF